MINLDKAVVKARKNPWMIATVFLAVILLILVAFDGFSSSISKSDAGKLMVSFLNSKVNGGVSLVDVEEEGSLYKVTVMYQSQSVPVYMTKDGEHFVSGAEAIVIESDDASITGEVIKSDSPVAELFVWSYCPYGVSAQKPFAEVASLLGDSADFKINLYYDGHGDYENQQNRIQACIQRYAPDKYWDYSIGFVDNIYPKCGASRDEECDASESIKLMNSLGIDSTKIMSCIDVEGQVLIDGHRDRAQELGVTGSPTFVVNGVVTQVARTAEAYKTAVCESFNTAPASCSDTLSTDAGTTSGSC